VEIDIRAAARLRGSAGAQAAVRPIVEALCGSDADLATVRVVCDWIQYRANFRETAMVRPGPLEPPRPASSPSTCAAAPSRRPTSRPR
jgi:hypothetical protein